MNVTIENLPRSQALVTVEIDPERLTQAKEEAYREIARKVSVPGFRKGRAPRHLVERYVGPTAIQDEAEQSLLPKIWDELVAGELKEMRMLGGPEPEIAQHDPLIYKLTVTLQPSVQLGEYKGIRLAPELVTVTEDDVNKVLEGLREENAQWNPTDRRPVSEGDQVVLTAHGMVGARPITVPQEGYTTTINAENGFIYPGFAMRLVGMVIGNEREFSILLPNDVGDPVMASAPGKVWVTIKEIKEKKLPPLDDDLAKTTGAATLDELRERIRTNLRLQREDEARSRMEDKVLDEVAKVSTVSFPDLMAEREVEHMIEQRTASLLERGLDMSLYLRVLRKTLDELRADLRPRAEQRLRDYLLVEELGRSEGTVVEESEVDAEIERMIALEADPVQARAGMNTPDFRDMTQHRLYVRRTLDQVISTVTEGMEPVAPAPAAEEPAAETAAEPAAEEATPAPAADEGEKPKLIIATH